MWYFGQGKKITKRSKFIWLLHRPFRWFNLCCFSISTIINYHQVAQNSTDLLSYSSVASEVWHCSHWAKIKVSARLHSFLGALGKDLFALPFPALRGCLHPWLVVSFLHLQRQQCCISLTVLWQSYVLDHSLEGSSPLSTHVIRLGPPQFG